jgi:AraC family transcriptional regulator of adaptative response/methylated-DNA-[protein]-cysteine methyltransferase
MDKSPIDFTSAAEDYYRIEQALVYLELHFTEQPGLQEVAASVHLSEYHFQRLFTRWVGISPKRFLQYLTKEYAKRLLENSHSLLDAAYESGLSGPSRLHDLFVTCEAVTPGEYKRAGENLEISYGFQPTPFGDCMLAVTERGICNLAFLQENDRQKVLQGLQKKWKNARLREDTQVTQPLIRQVFASVSGESPAPLRLYLEGTNFQIKVWEALLRIPPGSLVTYQDIALSIGSPAAIRAVGNAVARNPIPVLIPCHRVIRKMGDFGGYRWGTARKKALLGWEMAKKETYSPAYSGVIG